MRDATKRLLAGSLNDLSGPSSGGFQIRLSALLDEFGSRADAATVAGVVPNQLAKYVRGAAKPSLEAVARLAEAKGVSISWLWSGRGARELGGTPPQDDNALVRVPIYDVRAGAGFGQVAESENVIGALSFDPMWLLRRGIKPNGAFICFGSGDSMSPTIIDGDPIIADSTDKELRDKVFVCRRAGGLIIKRLQHRSDGAIVLISDNPSYAPEVLPRDDTDSLEIVGRAAMVLHSI